jgi:hypothetical protein
MSRLFQLRQDLAAAIIAAMPTVFSADNVILKRQGDLWNDIATAVAASASGMALHIGIAEGASTEDDGLEMEITVPLTLLCPPEVVAGATPEEDVWETLVAAVHDMRLNPADPYAYRFRFKSFSDIEVPADRGTAYLGRQTVFTRRLSL